MGVKEKACVVDMTEKITGIIYIYILFCNYYRIMLKVVTLLTREHTQSKQKCKRRLDNKNTPQPQPQDPPPNNNKTTTTNKTNNNNNPQEQQNNNNKQTSKTQQQQPNLFKVR